MRVLLGILLIIGGVGAEIRGGWYAADSLNVVRVDHASVALADGNILISGGEGTDSTLFSCEIYDYRSGKWIETAPMNSARAFHKMVLLPDNKVLAIGGWNNRSCEIYDPAKASWNFTDSLRGERWDSFTATLLPNGNVLVTGGYYLSFDSTSSVTLNSSEIYDFQTGKWTYTPAMKYEKSDHSATLLDNGLVLISGGQANGETLNVCELFDPVEMSWTETDTLEIARHAHNALLLQNGNVLISGGNRRTTTGDSGVVACELYDTENNSWSRVNALQYPRADHLSFNTGAADIIFFGGGTGSDSWEIFNGDSLTTVFTGDYPVRKSRPAAQKLPDGRILSIGGLSWTDAPTPRVYPGGACEIYDPYINSIAGNHNTPVIRDLRLFPNYPNPFNPQTVIRYQLGKAGKIRLAVFNLAGQEIETLVDKFQGRGYHSVRFDGTGLSSGVYFISLGNGHQFQVQKMIKIK